MVLWIAASGWIFLVLGCSREKTDSPPPRSSKPARPAEEAVPAGYQTMDVLNGGTIAGRVVFKGSWAPVPIAVTKDHGTCGRMQVDPSLTVGPGGGIAGAVVHLVDIHRGKKTAPVNAVLDQKGCRYEPHVLAFPVGTTLEILNSDDILHNVHSFSEKNGPFNRAQPKYRRKIAETFAQAERIAVRCDVHGWMSAWLFVSEHPYYAVTADGGDFALTDVPPGAYQVAVWQEKLGTQIKRVTVTSGKKASLDFELTLPAN